MNSPPAATRRQRMKWKGVRGQPSPARWRWGVRCRPTSRRATAGQEETGASQAAFDVIKRLEVALVVRADDLIFDEDGRGPDDELRFQFEAVSQYAPEDKILVKRVLDSLILSNEAKR